MLRPYIPLKLSVEMPEGFRHYIRTSEHSVSILTGHKFPARITGVWPLENGNGIHFLLEVPTSDNAHFLQMCIDIYMDGRVKIYS